MVSNKQNYILVVGMIICFLILGGMLYVAGNAQPTQSGTVISDNVVEVLLLDNKTVKCYRDKQTLKIYGCVKL